MRLFLIIACLLSGTSFAQIGMGQWKLHVPNKKAQDVVGYNKLVFAAFENGLLEYDINAQEASLWDNVNGLSDITISALGLEPGSKSVFIGYANGNIDQLVNNQVINIPALLLAEIQGNKRINKVVAHDGYVYVATGFCVLKIDPDKSEVKDTYYPTNSLEGIKDLAFIGDTLFAVTPTKLYKGLKNNPALADPASWSVDPQVPTITDDSLLYQSIEALDGRLYLLKNHKSFGNDSVFLLNSPLEFVPGTAFDFNYYDLGVLDNKITVFGGGSTLIYNSDHTIETNYYNSSLQENGFHSNKVIRIDDKLWSADNYHGLVEFVQFGESKKIEFQGPPRNEFYRLDWEKGKLAVAPGGVGDGMLSYRRAGVFVLEDYVWSEYDLYNIPEWLNSDGIWDNVCVAINPNNTDEIATGTFSFLPLSILDESGVKTTYDEANSTLEKYDPNDLYQIGDLSYDENGNLWVLNGLSSKPLNILSGGTWHDFSLGITTSSILGKKLELDYNDNAWIAFRNQGLVGYNPGNDLANPSDDKTIQLNMGEGAGNLPSNDVTAIAVDFDNEIWIGTDVGFAVLYNSEAAFDGDSYDAQRIKLEFEGNVEYVLGNTYVTDIEVDGANRKWMGTFNSGVVLLSSDGLEIIKQFTSENSPLISNSILDIEIDQETGEVYFITDIGLVSYRSDASYEDPDYSNVQVFPNPARPEFDGPITIQGIRYNSDVKITDAGGNLVYKTTSNGGTATWNGKTLQGDKVTSGVYLIWTTANESKGRYVGKVLVVN